MGLLRVHIHRGVNLAIRDVRSSDPYIVVRMGKQVTSDFYLVLFYFLIFNYLFISFLGFLGFVVFSLGF